MGEKSHGNFSLLQLIKGRWMMAVVSFYILFCCGATYIFAIYSGAIKKELHYNQETIDTLGFFKDLGANVGIVSGLMNEVLPAWTVLAMGALMNLFGYVMIWLAVTHRIARPPTWQMNLFLCIGANSQTFANTGVSVSFVKNFPQGRGEVLGIVKGCIGLSGAIFTQIYHALYGDDTRGVILLIGWMPSVVTLLFMSFIRPIKPAYDKREKRNFYSFLYLALLLAAFLMLAIIVQNQVTNFPSLAYKSFGAVTVLIVIANIVIGIRAENSFLAQVQERATVKQKMVAQELSAEAKIKPVNVQEGKEKAVSEHSKAPTSPSRPALKEPLDSSLKQDPKAQDAVTIGSIDASKMHATTSSSKDATHQSLSTKPKLIRKLHLFYKSWPKRGEDFTIPQAILSMDMLILFISLTCGVGATLTAIDNMGQIGESLGYSKKSISTFVSLISIWNFLGRVLAGFLSEMLLRRYRFPRTLMLTIVLALACVGHLLIAFPGPNTLYIASIMVGLCFGAQWPLLFAIISELFGLKYYATLYNVGAVASPLGSYLLNVRVAGHLYDKEAVKQHVAMQLLEEAAAAVAPSPIDVGGELKCIGSECFRLSFLIMTMVSAFASLVSTLLVLRTRKFYSQDIYSKFNVKPDDEI
ncbi:hypothetical protein GOP47_0016074 [Adiantum capillus-veneris]|uniref:Nodulin-like domain-containing protein n=1 Tax=Adiantum capillus-veneris TaxID=13818 RepID=A0A9D4ZBT4_ADICA|nr:hypothetical protein GOP47_0016074 [Adiantum capillus-veneris]